MNRAKELIAAAAIVSGTAIACGDPRNDTLQTYVGPTPTPQGYSEELLWSNPGKKTVVPPSIVWETREIIKSGIFPGHRVLLEEKPFIRQDLVAKHIEIPSIEISKTIDTVEYNGSTWIVPEREIVTPEPGMDILNNTFYVLQHNAWGNIPNDFHRLANLRIGDFVSVEGTRNGVDGEWDFKITRIIIADQKTAAELSLFNEKRTEPVLRIQTTAKETGRSTLNLPSEVLMNAELLTDLSDPTKYYIYVAEGELVNVSSEGVVLQP